MLSAWHFKKLKKKLDVAIKKKLSIDRIERFINFSESTTTLANSYTYIYASRLKTWRRFHGSSRPFRNLNFLTRKIQLKLCQKDKQSHAKILDREQFSMPTRRTCSYFSSWNKIKFSSLGIMGTMQSHLLFYLFLLICFLPTLP